MSDFKALANIPAIAELGELEGRRSTLVEQLDQVSPEVKGLYVEAQQKVDSEIRTIAQDTETQAAVAAAGISASEALDQLDAIRDVVDAEKIQTTEEQLEAKLGAVATYFNKYGAITPEAQQFLVRMGAAGRTAVTQTVENPSEKPSGDLPATGSAESAESEPELVRLFLSEENVRLGKRGNTVAFRKPREEQDYTEDRRKALLYLIENQGTPVKANELWDHVQPTGEPAGGDNHRPVRRWLQDLTFRSQPLIIMEEVAGKGVQYSVSSKFVVEVEEQPQGEELGASLDKPADEPVELSPTAEELLAQPVGCEAALYMLGIKLSHLGEVLVDLGKKPVPTDILEGLKEHQPDLSALKGNEDLLFQYREKAIAELEGLFEGDRLEEVLDGFEESSPEADLLDYMYDYMETEEEKDLIRRLMRSNWDNSPITLQSVDNQVDKVLLDQHGAMIWPVLDSQGQVIKRTLEEETVPVNSNGSKPKAGVEEELTDRKDIDLRGSSVDEEPDSLEVDEPRPERRKDNNRREKIKQVEREVWKHVNEFSAKLGIDNTYTINALDASFPGFARRILKHDENTSKSGVKNVRSGSERAAIGIREYIEVMLATSKGSKGNRVINTITTPRNRKIVKRVIDRIIETKAKESQTVRK